MDSVFSGIFLHAIGGIAAAACFLPQKGTQNWSYQTYWLLFCTVAWLITPITVAMLTIPNLGQVLIESPSDSIIMTTVLGGIFGFGGMAFFLAIRHIGFSLTYSIAIGISAVGGTVIPSLLAGTLVSNFSNFGGSIVLLGFIISFVGVGICGYAGTLKEAELSLVDGVDRVSNLRTGFFLVVVAGVLSSVFGMALAAGAPIDETAAKYGAGSFEGNAKYIFAMGGAFITNLIWWSVVHFRQGTIEEYLNFKVVKNNRISLPLHYALGILSGVLWYSQFFFYGLGHVKMGDFQHISWGIHMSMLIFFSFGIGYLLKEWSGLKKKTTNILYFGLAVLLVSFAIITYGTAIQG